MLTVSPAAHAQIVPLTVQAVEIIMADLVCENGQVMQVVMPKDNNWFPFINITHETGAKILRLFTRNDLELSGST